MLTKGSTGSVSTYLVQNLAGLDQADDSIGFEELKLTAGAMPGSEQRGGMSAASASLAQPLHTLGQMLLANARAISDDDSEFPPYWTRPDEERN